MINKVFLMGPVKNSPQTKTTDKGLLFGNFTVEARDNTEKAAQWIRVQGFGKVAESIQGLKENDVVIVEGKIESRKYTDPKSKEDKRLTYVSANKVVKFGSQVQDNNVSQDEELGF